ncbi:PepSY domain-containing protein [Pseudomonas sp.]|uniref:PepSY domain-containing protein n=1 Tax=Pseudomonas sp. TaxID=306 RepID=UPI002632599B|nr:PepSY domain-containing protein [Pseudomonas sp.]
MKTMNAVFATLALTAIAGFAQADVGPDEAVRLLKAGTVMDFEALNKAALLKHPGTTIHSTELENSYGRYIYKTELRDAKGVEWDVDLDAKTGEVLKDKQDS